MKTLHKDTIAVIPVDTVRFTFVCRDHIDSTVTIKISEAEGEGIRAVEQLWTLGKGTATVVLICPVDLCIITGDDIFIAISIDIGNCQRRRQRTASGIARTGRLCTAQPLTAVSKDTAAIIDKKAVRRSIDTGNEIQIGIAVDIDEIDHVRQSPAQGLAAVGEVSAAIIKKNFARRYGQIQVGIAIDITEGNRRTSEITQGHGSGK